MTLQYEDVKTTIRSYLSALMNDEERTVRFITNMVTCQFPGITRTEISETLYDNEMFIHHQKPNDIRVYWFLDNQNIEEMLFAPKPEGRVYVFVDCDEDPDIFRFLSGNVAQYETLFVRGYSNDEESAKSVHTLDDHDSKSIKKGYMSIIAIILSDLESVLSVHYDATCFIVTNDEMLICEVNELQNEFQESDLVVDSDSDNFRNMISSCV